MSTPIEFTTTTKGRPLTILDGYLYTQDRRTDTKTYWRLKKFREDVTDRAKCTQETTDTVLSQCISKLPDSARIRLPPLDHVKRTIQQHRKKIDLP
ncbi:unnamed protein product [Rotaria sp. Silwood2]|nr:unnamed protein product [Rotaria sp. Silwood2]